MCTARPKSWWLITRRTFFLDKAMCFGSFGQHPHEARKWTDEVEANLRKVLKHPKCVALGECGLDFHYMTSPKEDQLKAFRRQCQLAVELSMPLIVHSREAEDETVEILMQEMPREWHIHMHCFTSSSAMAKQLLEHFPNLFIGFTGVVTFKKADEVQSVVRDVPIERILLETVELFCFVCVCLIGKDKKGCSIHGSYSSSWQSLSFRFGSVDRAKVVRTQASQFGSWIRTVLH
jgi:TatD family hydrolase